MLTDEKDTVHAVVMAGGKGTRFGDSGALTPKCLLPLGNGQTLLDRVLAQLRDGGIRQVTICCSPGNHATISRHLENTLAPHADPPMHLAAVSCASVAQGPLPAMLEALGGTGAQWCLLCMADIFFFRPPYFAETLNASMQSNIEGVLLIGTDTMRRGSAGTGAITLNHESVRAISYRPEDIDSAAVEQRRWSGSFLFRSELLSDLNQHVSDYCESPYESWIAGLLKRGLKCTWLDVGDFVNVNSQEEYRELVRSSAEVNADSIRH